MSVFLFVQWKKWYVLSCCCSLAKSCPIPRSHGLQHASLPRPPLSPRDVHCIGDAIQPFHPLSSSFPSAFNLSQHQGLFQWVGCSHQVAKVFGVPASASALPMNTQGWFPLGLTGLISLQSKGLSRFFSNTTVQKHQFFGAQPAFFMV